MNPLFIVDGYSILFRNYYSIGEMATSQNVPIGAVFGFCRTIFSLITRYNVQNIVVALDSGKKTFRSELFTEYKVNRPTAPDDLIPQFAVIDEFLTAANITHFRKDGYEADDIIASIIKKESGREVVIVTSDKDLMQLVSDTTRCLDFFAGKFSGTEDVIAKFGIEPRFITDYLAMVGDKSDNVPGIKGCGSKNAVSLIQKFGTVEEIIANIANIENPRIKKAIAEHAQMGLLSKQLVTLYNTIQLDYESHEVTDLNMQDLMQFLEKYEIDSLKYLALKLSSVAQKREEKPQHQPKQYELL